MDSVTLTARALPAQPGNVALSALADEPEKSETFAEVLKKFDAAQEPIEERNARLEQEAKAAQANRERNTRINTLRSKIARLRQKLMSSGYDPKIAAELSAAQTELFWLMFSL